MIDLIKTFLLGIWVDKKYRFFFLFVIVASLYRFIKWFAVWTVYELSPVDFKGINDDGALVFSFIRKYDQVIYPKDFCLPTRYGRKAKTFDVINGKANSECEKKFFQIYTSAVNNLIRSSANGKFIIQFEQKFPRKIGEIIYIDKHKNSINIYETLKKQGLIFHTNENINYCKELSAFENK